MNEHEMNLFSFYLAHHQRDHEHERDFNYVNAFQKTSRCTMYDARQGQSIIEEA